MKRWQALLMLATTPLLLGALVWQTGRNAALAAEAKALEAEQRVWLEANDKLAGGIAVLESRERAENLAKGLGLERAEGPRRLFIATDSGAESSGSERGR